MRRFTLVIVFILIARLSIAGDARKQPSVKEPELRSELLRRAKADQEARRAITIWMMQFGDSEFASVAAFEATLHEAQKVEFQKLAGALRQVDAENTERMNQIVDQYGWPTAALVGTDGANAAWLLVQHADSSPQFQRKCLNLMTKVPRGEVSLADVAYLTDRVLLAEGKKQLYGTQFSFVNGKCIPRPLEDEADVDQRRADVGLPPLSEYLKESADFYSGRTDE
jgi:hypothetical protein